MFQKGMRKRLFFLLLFVVQGIFSTQGMVQAAAQALDPAEVIRLEELFLALEREGNYREAIPAAEAVLRYREAAFGENHPKTAASLNNLAALYFSMGNYDESIRMHRRALAIHEEHFGPDDITVARSLFNLAMVHVAKSEYAKAGPLYRRALPIFEKASGPDHLDTAATLNGLGTLYLSQNNYNQAEPLFRRALSIREKILGPDHSGTADILNNLAIIYVQLGAYDKAEPLYVRSLAIHEKNPGTDHPRVARSLGNLAEIYVNRRAFDKAQPLYERALRINEERLGSEHPDTASSLHNLAILKGLLGEYEKAEELSRRVLVMQEKTLGPFHPETVRSLINLAWLYQSAGRFDKAEQFFLQALAAGGHAGVPRLLADVYGRLMLLYDLRVADTRWRRPALAVWYGKQAVNVLQGMREHNSSLNRDLQHAFLKASALTYEYLSNLLIEQGRLAEAEQVLAMLKQKELAELLRNTAGPAGSGRIDYTAPERRAIEAGHMVAGDVQEMVELAALEKRRTSLTSDENQRRLQLQERAREHIAAKQRFLALLDESFAKAGEAGAGSQAKRDATELERKVALDPSGAVGLHYSVAPERIGIIVTTSRGSVGRFSETGREELARMVAALRQAVQDRRDTLPAAQALWRTLILPVQAELEATGARTLVIAPTGPLRYLPFAALQNAEGRYLVQDYAIALWAGAGDIQPQSARLVWKVAGMGLTRARGAFPALPAVQGELAGIVKTRSSPAGVLPGSIALDEAFTARHFDAMLDGRSNVMHVASHFDFHPGDESRSVLLLGKENETLSIGQIAAMNFRHIDLFALSACQTAMGGGINENGAEIEGLAAAVLQAKAQSVLATLWSVADTSTAEVMKRFYALKAKQGIRPTRAEALRQAQLSLLEGRHKGKPAAATGRGRVESAGESGISPASLPADSWKHPYYWAPFVLSGNWL